MAKTPVLFSHNRDGSWKSQAGGPREELAERNTWVVVSRSGVGASQTTLKTGVTAAVVVACRNGSGPT
ncbi:MAG TPA: hypothetical protein VMR62_34775 [Bryobacteraceae bacterium]|nr:hypothetical protein [Bryobacteraceae bacterium]